METAPRISASASTIRRSRPGEAPRARMTPNSRMRSITDISRVLTTPMVTISRMMTKMNFWLV